MTVVVLLGVMLALAALGVPLVFSILAASTVSLLIYRPGIPMEIVTQLFVSGMDKSVLQAIVFFFLAGELMNSGGITRRIVDFASALVGRIQGGLGHVNIIANIFFSGISGAAVADAAAVGTVMIPAMVRKGYSRGFSAAITQAASVIGPIIPPSIPVIIFAVLGEVSVGKMFLAGVVPGLTVGLGLMVAVWFISRKRNYPSEGAVPARVLFRRLFDAGIALGAPMIIVGGIVFGVFTATEAGAIAVLYSFIVGMAVYRELTWAGVWEALVRAAHGTATVMVIVGASTIFAWIVADMQVGKTVAKAIFSVSENKWIVFLLVNFFVLIVGLVMDPLAALVILVPIFLPTMTALGVDPVHFGIVIVLNLMIGLCTPPVGYLIYLSAAIADTSPEDVIRESTPFILALLAVLLLCVFVPEIVLALPRALGF